MLLKSTWVKRNSDVIVTTVKSCVNLLCVTVFLAITRGSLRLKKIEVVNNSYQGGSGRGAVSFYSY